MTGVLATRRRGGLLAGTALQAAMVAALTLPAAAQPAPNARPVGGTVTAGSATITNNATTTTITQSSQRAAINWQGFNVGAQQSVDFVQPSSTSVALNRVTGANPSQIAGRIDANGQVILINQDGVTFYKGAQVNTAGLVVSAAGMTNQNFMAGRMVFDQAAHAGATISNAGNITVAQAGLAALVAPQVANSGVISAKLGHVVLAGAMTHTLDLYGDGLINLDVSNQVTQAPGGATALVTNTGIIVAQGGTVLLTARAADGVVQNLVAAGGTISAPSVGSRTGTILVEGVGGNIAIAGSLLAQGTAAGTHGGAIQILPSGTAIVATGAVVDASGAAGGGTVALGTTLARAAGGQKVTPTATSKGVIVATGARVAANATGHGNGGHITLLSTDSTVMAGTIAARGGPGGGNGGFVEVSGGTLGFSGGVDIAAPKGTPGTVLFDPATLDIVATDGGDDTIVTGTSSLGIIAVGLNPGSTDTVSAVALNSIGSGNILLQAQTFLDVQASVVFTTHGAVALQSFGNLAVEAGVTLNANSTAGLTLIAGTGSTGGIVLDANATLLAPTVSLLAGSGGIQFGNGVISTALLNLSTTGGANQTGGTLDVTTLTGSMNGLALGSGNNAIGTLGSISAGPTLSVTNGGSMTVGGPISATSVSLNTTSGNLTIAGPLNAPAGLSLFEDTGSVVQTAGTIATGTLSVSAAGSIDLFQSGNSIGVVSSATAAIGLVRIADGTNLVLAGGISGSNVTLELAGGDVLTLGLGTLAAATVTALSGGGAVLVTADHVSESPAGGTITTAGNGSITFQPVSIATIDLVSGGGGLVLDGTLLAHLSTGTIVVGNTTNATSITLQGAVNLNGIAGTLDLLTTGSITEPGGPLTVGVLLASGNGINLGTQANAITTLGAISAGSSLAVSNGLSLTVAGPLNAGSVALSASTGDVTVNGTITATGSVALNAPLGNITENTSAAITGLAALSGNAGGSVDLGSSLNAIGTLGSLTAGTALTVVNGTSLTVNGPVSGNSIGLTATGNLGLAGDLTSPSVALTASGGSISQTGGTLLVGTLTASAGGSIDLFQPGNSIGGLTDVTASGGVLRVADGTNLTTLGTLSGQGLTLEVATAGDGLALGSGLVTTALTATGGGALLLAADRITEIAGDSIAAGTVTIAPFSANAVSLGGSGIGLLVIDSTLLGEISATTLVVGSVSTASAVSIDGSVAPAGVTTLDLLTSGSIMEPTGTLSIPVLSAAASTGITLGTAVNAIGMLGTIVAGPSLLVTNGISLTVAGSLSAGSVTLRTVTGDLILDGTVAGSTAVSLTASAGNVTEGAGGAITGLGTLSGSASLAFDAGSTLNAIGTLGAASAGTTLSVGNSTSFAIAGAVSANTVGLTTSAGGILQSGGSITAVTLTGSADGIALGLSNAIGTLGDISAGPSLLVADGGAMVVAGSLSATSVTLSTATGNLILDGTIAAGGGVALTATLGNVIEGVAGAITGAPTLSGSAELAFDIGSALNGIGALGTISAGTVLAVANAATLAITGAISADSVALTTSAGDIVESGGSITAVILTASAAGSLDLSSTLNAIGTVDGASAGGALLLANGTNLTALGTLSGASEAITVAAAGGVLMLGAGVSLTSAGSIALTADDIAAPGAAGITGSAVTLAPFSAIPVSLGGSGAGTLGLGSALLADISATTLVVGSVAKATGISIDGDVAPGGATLELLTSGAITESGGTLSIPVLTATASIGVTLGTAGNAIGTVDGIAAGGALTLTNGTNLTVLGTLSGASESITVAAAGDTLALGDGAALTAGSIVLTADQVSAAGGGTISGTLVSIAPFSSRPVSLLGSGAGTLALGSTLLSEIGAGTLVVGSLTTTTNISIDGSVAPAGVTTLELLTSGAITEPGGTLAIPVLLATAGTGVALGTAQNAIGTVDGIAAGGALTLTNGTNLTVLGTLGGTSETITVAATGDTLTLGARASLTAASIALTADRLTDLGGGTIAASTVVIAPFSATPVSLAGAGGGTLVLGTTLLSEIGAGTLVVGSLTTATGISIGGAVAPAGVTTLELLTSGAVTEPGGTLSIPVLTVVASTGVTLNSLNAIGTVDGIAAGGALTLTNGTDLTALGTLSGSSEAITVAATGDALALGAGVLLTSAGSIVLTADSIAVPGAAGIAGSTVTLAPFSARPVSLGGGAAGTLALGTALLDDISATTLVVGSLSTATGISVDGAVAPGGVATLELLTSGAITEPGGTLAIPVLTATASSGVSLPNSLNAIGTVDGIVAGGALTLSNGTNLLALGTVSGLSETITIAAAGDTLTLGDGASLSAGSILLAADGIVAGGADTLVASTVTLLPFSAIPVSLGGTGAGTLALSTALLDDISATTLVVGSVTKATGISVAGDVAPGGVATLELLTAGGITEPGGTLAIPVLTATAGSGVSLPTSVNAIGTVDDIAAGGALVLSNGTNLTALGTLSGSSESITVAATGDTLKLGAGVTLAAGSIALAADTIAVPGAASIIGTAVTLAPFSAIQVSLAGSGSGKLVLGNTLLDDIAAGTLVVGSLVTATGIGVDGTVAPAGVTTLELLTSGAITEPGGGTLIIPTLLATAGGGVTLATSQNAIGTVDGIAAGGALVLTNGTSLLLQGTLSAASETITIATPTGALALGGTTPATLTATSIALTANTITDIAGNLVSATSVTIVPFSAETISLAGTATAGQLLLDTTLLPEINATTLTVGSLGRAPGIVVAGTADLTGHVATLDLLTSGAITEPAGGVLAVPVLTATAGGDVLLGAIQNAIGTADGIAAGGLLTLNDGANLTALGTLSATSENITVAMAGGTLALGADATLTAGGIALTADRITDLAGDAITAPTVSIAPFSATAISLAGAPGAHLLLDSTLLAAITTGTLTIGNTTEATGISVDGPVNLSANVGTLDLLTFGSITEPGGPLTIDVLTAIAGGDIALGSGANGIGTLDTLRALGGISIADGQALVVAGSLGAGSITLAAAGSIDVLAGITAITQLVLAGQGVVVETGAPVTAATIQLNGGAGGVTLTGSGVVGTGTTTLDLIGGGGVTEASTSTILAALLTSSTGIGGTVALLGSTNVIAAIGGFAVSGGDLNLAESGSAALTVAGPVSAGNVTLGTPGGLPGTITVAGGITATHALALNAINGIALASAADIDAPAITLASSGPITLAAGALVGDALSTVGLSSANAVIEDPGSRIVAATLDSPGGIAGTADLGGTANAIATLGNMNAGALVLEDGGAALAIAGTVAVGGTVLVGDVAPPPSIAVPGNLSAQAITLESAGGITLSGSFDAAGVAELDAAGGSIAQTGSFAAGTLQSVLTQGAASFAGASVATLGSFLVADGAFSLNDIAGLTVAGPVSAANIAIASAGGIVVAGTIAGGSALALSAGSGGITLGGSAPALLVANTVSLASQGRVTEPDGNIVATVLAATGSSAAASMTLNGAGNTIAVLGAVSLAGGAFNLTDTAAPLLTVTGPVSAGNITIGTPGTLLVAGAITAGGLNTLLSLSAGSGGIVFGTDGTPATISTKFLDLASQGGITEPNGTITAFELTANAVTGIDLGNSGNAITALDGVTVSNGDLLVADGAAPLSVLGPVSATDITLDAASALVIGGTLTAVGQTALTVGSGGIAIGIGGGTSGITTGTLVLTSGGDITEPNGTITAAVLTGSSTGATVLDGTNSIAQFTNFTAGTTLALADSVALTLAGTLRAPLIQVQDPGQVTLAGGATIVTGGTTQPADFLLLDASPGGEQQIEAALPTFAKPSPTGGAYLTVGSFTQLGTSTIASLVAATGTVPAPDILRIDATGAGDITFNSLQAQSTWLLLGVSTGKVSGAIFVRSLTLQYPIDSTGAELSGSIAGITGQAAAGDAVILPLPDNKFRLNDCPLHSINCVLLPLETVPAASPLQNFTIGTLLDDDDDDSLLLPIVSSQDY